jgi:hypothetical protein
VTRKFLELLFFAAVILFARTIHAQGTAFMYQGQLNDGGSPANGIYDLRFAVFDAVTNGNAISGSLTNLSVPASNGLFDVTLDFGANIFTGPDRWLDIAVRASGATNFTALFPRQKITPVPYAIFANSASNLVGNLAATQLTGTLPGSAFAGFTNSVNLTNGANSFSGTFSGNGTNLVNLDASQLTGGTLADARLSTNVALLNANQTFSGMNTFTNFGNSFRGSFFGNGLVGWLVQTGTTVQAVIDTGYVLTNSLEVTVRLPVTSNIGDIVRISGAGSGGWSVLQNSNQSVVGNFSGFTNSSWVQSSAVNANWAAIASSSDGTKMVAAANGSGQLYNSIDSGKDWFSTGPLSGQWQAVASSADGTKLVAAIKGGNIYTSTNSGSTWVVRTSVVKNWSSFASSADGVRLVGVVSNEFIYASPDSGVSWNSQSPATSRNWSSVASSANGSNLVATVKGGGIYTNSGSSWTATSALVKNWISVASSADGSKLAAVETGGGIYTSVNSGSTWTLQTNAPSLTWAAIASSSDGGKLAAASQGGGIYTSINFGTTWTQQSGTTGKNWNCIASSASGGTLAAGVSPGSGLYYAQAALQTVTTPGTSGGISGTQGSAVELQYIGNNQWMPVSSVGTIWAN